MQQLAKKLPFHPFWFALLAPVLIGLTLHWSMEKLLATTSRVTHTHQVLTELDDIPLQIEEAQTAHHDYVLTGDTQYLAAFQQAEAATHKEIEEVQRLISKNRPQQARLTDLNSLADERFAQLQHTIDLRTTEGFDSALHAISSDESANFSEHMNILTRAMENDEWQRLAHRSAVATASAHQLDALIAGGSALALLLIIVANVIITGKEKKRSQIEAEQNTAAAWNRGVFANASDGVVTLDSASIISNGSHASEVATGGSEHEWVARQFRAIFLASPVRNRSVDVHSTTQEAPWQEVDLVEFLDD
jgi:CHASE3 domain sensor protein